MEDFGSLGSHQHLADIVAWSRSMDLQLPLTSGRRLEPTLEDDDELALAAWAAELEAQQAPAPEDFPQRAALLRRVLALSMTCKRPDKACELEKTALAAPASPRRSAQKVPATEHLEFAPVPPLLRISKAHVLATRLGERIKHSGCMTGLLVALSALLLSVTVLKPGSEFIPREGPLKVPLPSGEVSEMRTIRRGLLTWLLEDLGFPAFWFLMLHYLNRALFVRVLFTFDTGIILASFVLSEFAKTYNRCDFWGRHGYYDTTWMVCDALRTVLVVLPCGVAVSTLDSWKVTSSAKGLSRSRLKIGLSALATCYFLFSLYGTYDGPASHRWSDVRVYFGPFSFVPRNLFRASEIQKVIFLAKAMFKYILGNPFAFIRPAYVRNVSSPLPCRQTSGDAQSGSSSDGSDGSDTTSASDL